MSIVTTSELATHMGLTSAPFRAQASLDAAEAFVAAYLSLHRDSRGNPIQQHTVTERIRPVRDRENLEVSHGYVTGIESIVYDVDGYRHTRDELGDDSATETPTFAYVHDPESSGWTVRGYNDDGTPFLFRRNVEYRVTYRTGWCAGSTAYSWEWRRTDSSDTWDDAADRLSWGFVDGTATTTNASGGYLFGLKASCELDCFKL